MTVAEMRRRSRAIRAAKQYMRLAAGPKDEIPGPGHGLIRRLISKMAKRSIQWG